MLTGCRPTRLVFLALLLIGPAVAVAAIQDPPDTKAGVTKASREMAEAAGAFQKSLTADQAAAAGFAFDDDERLNWHYIPKERKGLALKMMGSEQRERATALLKSALSDQGLSQVLTIISLEQVLHDIEKGSGPVRDPELYFWSIFGAPGGQGPWGWRVEGHHISINFTIVGDLGVAVGPRFVGSNPGEVRSGPKQGTRAMAAEEDDGRALAKSLSADQKKTGILEGKAPAEIITGSQRKAMLDDPKGIAYAELDDTQKAALMELVGRYANRLRPELARDDLRRIAAAGLDKLRFAWAGELEPAKPHYYRIHGPTFLIEYDNVQNNANHIHTVWRDLENDFGGDLLRKHYDDHKHDREHEHR